MSLGGGRGSGGFGEAAEAWKRVNDRHPVFDWLWDGLDRGKGEAGHGLNSVYVPVVSGWVVLAAVPG